MAYDESIDSTWTGRLGEAFAAAWLGALGYRILRRNYLCRSGEADIVAWSPSYTPCASRTLVLVEVKSRSTHAFGDGRQAISAGKLKRMARVAQHAAYDFGKPSALSPPDLRLDVISVSFDSMGVPRCSHLMGVSV